MHTLFFGVRADKARNIFRPRGIISLGQQPVPGNRCARLRVILACLLGNSPSRVVENGRDHQILISKSRFIRGEVVQPLGPAEYALCMFVARVSEFRHLRPGSVPAFALILLQGSLYEQKHSPVIRASQSPDGRFLRLLPALLPEFLIRHVHHAHFPPDKRLANPFEGFAVPLHRDHQRPDPDRFHSLQRLMHVRLPRDGFPGNLTEIIIILLFEYPVRIMAVLLSSDHYSVFPDGFRNNNPSRLLSHFTLHGLFRRFPGFYPSARKLIAVVL